MKKYEHLEAEVLRRSRDPLFDDAIREWEFVSGLEWDSPRRGAIADGTPALLPLAKTSRDALLAALHVTIHGKVTALCGCHQLHIRQLVILRNQTTGYYLIVGADCAEEKFDIPDVSRLLQELERVAAIPGHVIERPQFLDVFIRCGAITQAERDAYLALRPETGTRGKRVPLEGVSLLLAVQINRKLLGARHAALRIAADHAPNAAMRDKLLTELERMDHAEQRARAEIAAAEQRARSIALLRATNIQAMPGPFISVAGDPTRHDSINVVIVGVVDERTLGNNNDNIPCRAERDPATGKMVVDPASPAPGNPQGCATCRHAPWKAGCWEGVLLFVLDPEKEDEVLTLRLRRRDYAAYNQYARVLRANGLAPWGALTAVAAGQDPGSRFPTLKFSGYPHDPDTRDRYHLISYQFTQGRPAAAIP